MEELNVPAHIPKACSDAHSFVFLGEAGCGKSEVAINLAKTLAAYGNMPVHFFDLDMTKPLFRARDQAHFLQESGITVHFEEQFYDAPTATGGVDRLLRDESCYTVLDVGGDHVGARLIGRYAPLLNRGGVVVWYIINPYRPWSADIEHIDGVLSRILGVSHVQMEKLHLIGNPNLGPETTAEEVKTGALKLLKMVGEYKTIDYFTVSEKLVKELKGELPGELYPIRLYLTYEWAQE